MEDFQIKGGVLIRYLKEDETAVTVPEGVTRIEDEVFWNHVELQRIEFPKTLRSIGEYAFRNCRKLAHIVFPDGMEHIGYWSFYACRELKTAIIPASVTEIERGAFEICPLLTIHAPAGSYAEKYAKENGIKFELT